MTEVKTRKNKGYKKKFYRKEAASKRKATQKDLEDFMKKFNRKNHKE